MASLYEDYLQLMKDDPALAEEWLESLDDDEFNALISQSTQKKGLRQHSPAYSSVENPVQRNPDISWADRLGVKNFGNATSIDSLSKKYPNLTFEKNSKGQITYRQNEGTDPNVYVLDPDKPELMDILDSGRDIVQGALGGIAQGATTATVGAATKSPALALGLGATAAGATEAGVDYLSQKLGEVLGYNEGVDLTDAAIAGGFGAASSFLPGNPFTAGQAKKLYQAGIPNPGEFGRPLQTGARNTVDRFGHLVGAPDKATMQLGRRKMKGVVDLEKKYDDPLLQETKAFKKDLENDLFEMESSTWAEIERAIQSSQEPVDLREPRNLLNQWIGELQAKKKVGLSGPEKEELARLQDLRSKHFFLEREVAVPPEMTGHPDIPLPGGSATPATELTPRFSAGPTAKEVRDLNKELRAYVDYAKSEKGMGDDLAQRMSVRVKKLRESISRATEKAVPEIGELNNQYRKIQRHRENLHAAGFVDQGRRDIDEFVPVKEGELSEAFTPRDDAALNKLRKDTSPSAKNTIKQIDAFLGKSGPDSYASRAETLKAANSWMHPSKVNEDVKGAGTKEYARLLTGAIQPTIGGGAIFGPTAAFMFPDNPLMAGTIGTFMGFGTGAAVNKVMSPAMQRKYIRSSQAVRDLVDKFGPAPLIGSKAATQTLLNPWGEPE